MQSMQDSSCLVPVELMNGLASFQNQISPNCGFTRGYLYTLFCIICGFLKSYV